ncbi:MAG: dihydrofolate reductase family protein [Candidatus Heimdallarchaeota archaeon]
MEMNRPETTLFLMQSLDGKISTGDVDERDQEIDFPKIKGIKEGNYQYYQLLLETDRHALISGKVLAKVGINSREKADDYKDVSLIIIDRKPHLTNKGVNYLLNSFKSIYIITNNKNHPALLLTNNKEINIIYFQDEINIKELFGKLKQDYKIEKLSIQSGGTLNSLFLKLNLIDHISLIIAPCLIGGKSTPTSIDGTAPRMDEDLFNIKALKLKKCKVLKHSYIYLYYDVINETTIEKN